jgi:hypothetical protein
LEDLLDDEDKEISIITKKYSQEKLFPRVVEAKKVKHLIGTFLSKWEISVCLAALLCDIIVQEHLELDMDSLQENYKRLIVAVDPYYLFNQAWSCIQYGPMENKSKRFIIYID